MSDASRPHGEQNNMRINMQQWSEDILRAGDVKNLPVLYFPAVRNLGMDIPSSVKDPGNIARVMREVIDEYPDTLAALTGMDLTVDAEAFGAAVSFSEKQAPHLNGPLLRGQEDIPRLAVPDIHSGRVDIFAQACARAQASIADRPVFGGMLGPFSLAANLLEINTCLKMTIRGTAYLHTLLEKCCDWLTERAKAYKAAGANGVFIAEPTAGLLSPQSCETFSSRYIKKIADSVQEDHFFLILHNCGQVERSVGSMCSSGCRGLHFGNGVNMKNVLPAADPDLLIMGNLDPSSVFFMGTPETVYQKTLSLLEEMAPYPNFILSSGCDLAPSVDKANIDAYYKACRDYNQRG